MARATSVVDPAEAQTMTQQYLVGELSVCLEQLQAVTAQGAAQDVARLRHQVEMGAPASLGAAALRALALADSLCWESLSHGAMAAFTRQSQVSAELRRLGVCARLISEACGRCAGRQPRVGRW